MKRIISILLAVVLVASCVVATSAYGWTDPDILTADEGIEEHELLMGEEVATNRYYFLMPNGKNGDIGDDDSVDEEGKPIGNYGNYAPTWFIEMSNGEISTDTAAIYWWETGVADPAAWVGYLPSGVDENDPYVFYANVPQAVTTIIWNNAVDGGMDKEQPIYFCAAQTVNIPCEYYDPDESPNYPDGTDSFDNMIYVIDPDLVSYSEYSQKQTCGGEWYYYYGNGCYGFTEDGTEADCIRGDHFDADGNHVIPVHEPPVKPGNPEELPTVPTEDPSSEDPSSEEPSSEEPSSELPSEPSESESTDAPSEIPSEDANYILGDADGDGELTVVDASLIQLVLVGKKPAFEGTAILAADADKDGEITVVDASLIQLVLVGKKPPLVK